jgi:predicted aminopeptidase
VTRSRVALLAAALAALAGIASCSHVGYYAQSVAGQLDVFRRERPIADVIADPATEPRLRERLARVAQIRAFAVQHLALPDNGSYRTYADLERPYVVWNVFAAQPLSLQPLQWCFPVAGCVGYRGYFSKAAADAFADGLRASGLDVFVGGVPAYSTLGWFDDPVLNTFVQWPEVEVARILFHELAHQLLYLKDDSVFNESFATAVEIEGVSRWIAAHGTPGDRAQFERGQARRRAFGELIGAFRPRFEALYASPAPGAERLAGKATLFAELQSTYRQRSVEPGGPSGYDHWILGHPNNAMLASIGIYTQLVPGFQAMLAAEGNDLPRFYAAVRTLASAPKAERERRLATGAPSDGPAREVTRADPPAEGVR